MNVPMPSPSSTADQRRLFALIRALNDDDLITLAIFLDLSVVAAAAGEPDGPDHPPGGVHAGPSRALVLDLAAAELTRRLAAAGVVVWRPLPVGLTQPPPVACARRRRAARFPRGRGCRR